MAKNTKAHARKAAAQAKGDKSAAAVSAAPSKSTAQPGVIASIVAQLEDAKKHKKGVTAQHILDTLVKKFPDRAPMGMMITVRAQLSRLPKERDFAITKTKDGRTTLYSAA